MQIINLADCPDGQHVAVWEFDKVLWSVPVRVVNHTITEEYQSYDHEDRASDEQWVEWGNLSTEYSEESLRIITNVDTISNS